MTSKGDRMREAMSSFEATSAALDFRTGDIVVDRRLEAAAYYFELAITYMKDAVREWERGR